MEELKTLIKLVDEPLLGLLSGNSKKLVVGLISGKYQTRKDAFDLFESKNEAILLSQLISKTKNKLKNYVFLSLGMIQTGTLQAVLRESYREFFLVKILITQGKQDLASQLGEKLLKVVIDYELIDLVFMLGKELVYFAGTKGNMKRFEELNELVEEYSKEILKENEILYAYIHLIRDFKDRKEFPAFKGYNDFANKYKPESLKSIKAFVLYINIKIFILLFEYDYAKVIEVSDQALKELSNRKGAFRSHFLSLRLRKSVAHLALKEFDQANAEIDKCEDLVIEKGYNSEIIKINRLINLVHAEQFEKAVILSSNYSFTYLKEWHKILEAYLNCILEVKQVSAAKFLNEVPTFSKDKAGFNIMVIGVQILLLLKKRKYSKMLDRIDYLKSYKNRYLRTEATKRAKLFIKMLLQLGNGNFNLIAVKRRTQKYYEEMTNEKFEIPLNLDIEIIPFDQLWIQITKLLDKPVRKIVKH